MSCQIKNNANLDLTDLQPHINGMYDHFHQKLGFQKPPVIVFDSDPSNQSNVLGKTAYYDPQSFEVHIFTDGRHPKDMLRSIAHELIHHQQNLEGRLDVGGYNGPGYYLENDKMKKIEQEAMLEGNKLLREYEDGLKLEEMNKMSLKEWKNNELNSLLLKKFGILKEEKKKMVKHPKTGKMVPDYVVDGDGSNDEADLEEGRLSPRTTNPDKFVGHEDRYQPDRIHEADEEELDEGQICEECGGKHYMKEEGVEETVRKITTDNAGRHGQGTPEQDKKNIRESIRRTLKENRAIRLKIKR